MKRTLIYILALYCSLAGLAKNGNNGESRTATVKMNISSSDIINIKAKYTDLTVEAWEKDEVLVEASIRYDGKMTDKIQAFLDQFEQLVKENIKYSEGELLIDSGVDFPSKGVKKSFFGLVVEINLGDFEEAKLEYKIKSPPSNKYIINSSYRDMNLLGSFSEIDLTQYSGDLSAEFIEKAELNLKYGSAKFKGIGDADMEIYEQEIECSQINNLKLNAKYSDLEIMEIGRLEAISYESDYVIGSIRQLSGNFKYGEIEITQEIGTAKLTLYEEDIEARKIEKLTIDNSKYSKIEIARADEITLKESYEDEISIGALKRLTSKNSKYGKYNIDQLQGQFELNGYEDEIEIDDIANSATKVSLEGKYLDVSLGAEDVPFTIISSIKYGNVNYNEDKVDIRKYIKDNDHLEVELYSIKTNEKQLQIAVNGYEIDLTID